MTQQTRTGLKELQRLDMRIHAARERIRDFDPQFEEVEEPALILERLDGIAASTGSACHEGLVELSPVLAAMGVAPDVGGGAVRFSLGRGTTEDEIAEVLARVRALDLY